jgi:hypothetical protein
MKFSLVGWNTGASLIAVGLVSSSGETSMQFHVLTTRRHGSNPSFPHALARFLLPLSSSLWLARVSCIILACEICPVRQPPTIAHNIQSCSRTFCHGNVRFLLLYLHSGGCLYHLVRHPDLLRRQSTFGHAALHLRHLLGELWKYPSGQRKHHFEAALGFLHGLGPGISTCKLLRNM